MVIVVRVYAERPSCSRGTYIHRYMEARAVFLHDGQDVVSHDDKAPGPKNSLVRDPSWSWDSSGKAEAVWDDEN